jgi:ribosomal protein L29
MKIELQAECVSGLVRADLKSALKNLRDDLKRRKAGHGMSIFCLDREEDIAEIKRHIAALETVIRYYT